MLEDVVWQTTTIADELREQSFVQGVEEWHMRAAKTGL